MTSDSIENQVLLMCNFLTQINLVKTNDVRAQGSYSLLLLIVATEESMAKTTTLTTQILLEPTTSDTNSVPQGNLKTMSGML